MMRLLQGHSVSSRRTVCGENAASRFSPYRRPRKRSRALWERGSQRGGCAQAAGLQTANISGALFVGIFLRRLRPNVGRLGKIKAAGLGEYVFAFHGFGMAIDESQHAL